MNTAMFCYQCEQTAHNKACTGKKGVCGKLASTANLQDNLTGALISLSLLVQDFKQKNNITSISLELTHTLMLEGLFITLTNVNFNDEVIEAHIKKVYAERERILSEINDVDMGKYTDFDMSNLWKMEGTPQEDIRSLKSLLLFGLRGMAAYAYHAKTLGYSDDYINNFFYIAMSQIGQDLPLETLLNTNLELGAINFKCMELLDKANTETYGTPKPTPVSLKIEKGPFIVITGHDLYDLKCLLNQTENKGINIYTHGEMLPAHAYPELKKYVHLKGHFGTAWQNQQKEFDNLPAPILFTTNCLMPIKESYKNAVFTAELVSYPRRIHIGQDKDFTHLIEKSIELGGYTEEKECKGMNSGKELMTGFGHGTILSIADKIVDAVKQGAIKHFFLVAGCDGAKIGRSYYTEFVKQAPQDSIILTLACGKFRFNDLNIGEIGGLPRIMDMGQCNDAYGAIKVALALSDAFHCDVNELPLTLNISWYEQKAVCILLTLLHLGIKNIYLGPSLPAFISPNILNVLVEKYALSPISTPENDLKKILA